MEKSVRARAVHVFVCAGAVRACACVILKCAGAVRAWKIPCRSVRVPWRAGKVRMGG